MHESMVDLLGAYFQKYEFVSVTLLFFMTVYSASYSLNTLLLIIATSWVESGKSKIFNMPWLLPVVSGQPKCYNVNHFQNSFLVHVIALYLQIVHNLHATLWIVWPPVHVIIGCKMESN